MKYSEFEKSKFFSEASGVLAYYSNNFEIKLNQYGFFEDFIVNKEFLSEEATELFVSPNFNSSINEDFIAKKLYSDVKTIKFDHRLGFYLSLYAGHAVDGDLRKNSSSGGITTWILLELMKNNLIDGVIHVKKSEKGSKTLFNYGISYTSDEIIQGSKTKYYPVEFSECLKVVRREKKRYAFVGIPSFVMAIRLLQLKDPVINDSIVFTIGLISGHQKSSAFTDSLALESGIKPEQLINIDYRKKNMLRRASDYDVEIEANIYGKELKIIKPAKDFIASDWGQGFFKVKASDFTDDVFNETADITLGDAWLEDYVNDSLGNNIVIIRNSIIDNIINKANINNLLRLDNLPVELILKSQESHYRHTYLELGYRLWKLNNKKKWRPIKRVDASKKISLGRKMIQDIRETVSYKSHLYFNKSKLKDNYGFFKNKSLKLKKKYKIRYYVDFLISNKKSEVLKLIFNKIRNLKALPPK